MQLTTPGEINLQWPAWQTWLGSLMRSHDGKTPIRRPRRSSWQSASVANDVGVVYLKSGATVMVFLSDQIRGNYGEAESRLADIARHVAEYFDGK